MAGHVLLNITDYTTVTPTRVVDEENNVRVPITSIDVVVFLDAPVVVETPQGKKYTQAGVLRTKRESDLQDGDEIELPEGVFGVVGGPRQNRNHSMTGSDFGWARYTIRKGG